MSVYSEQRADKKLEKIIDHIETPAEGGYIVWHKTFTYPEKGYRNNYIVQLNNFAKKVFITWVRFLGDRSLVPLYFVFLLLPYKIRIIEKWLKEVGEIMIFVHNQEEYLKGFPYYYNIHYYSPLTRELYKFLSNFLVYVGISEETAKRFSFSLVTLIEYDRAYYWRLEDLFNETSVELLLKNPRKEILKLARLLRERDKHLHVISKFENMARLGSYIFLVPKIRKAFNKALKEIDFSKLQMDEAERYLLRNSYGYDYFGMTYEERIAKWPLEPHDYFEVDYSNPINTDERLDELFIR